ncbi:Sulfotransferase 1C4 [Holothuria leucospilota]|uniref:Sulfotransferase 1C4 n=1 Tax=Holothuria leucospilota TaxID=206669 RepID=A0A9Q1BN96_HOLLE|nr:Sulfotransferase 1C4 [Holothuria leucospilota]
MPAHINDFLMKCDDGNFLTPLTPPRFLLDILEMEMRSSDVIVVTWPKSGTTWMQYIVTQLICGTKIASEKNLFETNTYLELVENPLKPDDSDGLYKKAQGLPSPRLFKSHLKQSMLPTCLLNSEAKVIYVVRNPKDAAVSYFNFCLMNPVLPPYKNWSEFFEHFCKGLLPWGDWFENVLPWGEKKRAKCIVHEV